MQNNPRTKYRGGKKHAGSPLKYKCQQTLMKKCPAFIYFPSHQFSVYTWDDKTWRDSHARPNINTLPLTHTLKTPAAVVLHALLPVHAHTNESCFTQRDLENPGDPSPPASESHAHIQLEVFSFFCLRHLRAGCIISEDAPKHWFLSGCVCAYEWKRGVESWVYIVWMNVSEGLSACARDEGVFRQTVKVRRSTHPVNFTMKKLHDLNTNVRLTMIQKQQVSQKKGKCISN